MDHCTRMLSKGNLPANGVQYEDTMPDGKNTHFVIYTFLKAYLGRHIQKGNQNPVLSLLLKPREVSSIRGRGAAHLVAEFPNENLPDITDNELSQEEDSDWE
ncbi:uncharacterized protein H6S33_002892 [Morchella sextelata]|uniref:uncharacterized protein n=1 Tax=Morchella sextelata TaxID=1174677 RepID=UPI001D057B4F|nr:uncharacterized protein H6S33_002892 [Morchella sextelata]KAH0606904.1 hypothetical protein H6S33_002892 [Morchella sextelata]